MGREAGKRGERESEGKGEEREGGSREAGRRKKRRMRGGRRE